MISKAFQLREWAVAAASAAGAQSVFFLLFSSSAPAAVRAEISDEMSRPIAVSITPVPVLKLGSNHAAPLPRSWQRRAAAPEPTATQATLPSPQAEQVPEAIPSAPVSDAAVPPPASAEDAEPPAPGEPSSSASAGPMASGSPGPGSPEGSEQGTETDPLKARAIGMYRGQLASWFLSRFSIRGKIPFDTLKTLRAAASVSITPDRRVGGYSLGSQSGNAVFDGEVRSTLASIQASGAQLPAPPPSYPDVLGQTLSVSFQCTVRSQCE